MRRSSSIGSVPSGAVNGREYVDPAFRSSSWLTEWSSDIPCSSARRISPFVIVPRSLQSPSATRAMPRPVASMHPAAWRSESEGLMQQRRTSGVFMSAAAVVSRYDVPERPGAVLVLPQMGRAGLLAEVVEMLRLHLQIRHDFVEIAIGKFAVEPMDQSHGFFPGQVLVPD